MHNLRFMLPPLTSVIAFEAAARHMNIAAAANELAVTRAAVSRQVKSLEIYLGQHLFTRAGSKLTLTKAGEYYLEQVSDNLIGIARASQQLLGNGNGENPDPDGSADPRDINPQRPVILLVDDEEINFDILQNFIGDDFEILYEKYGNKVAQKLLQNPEIELILLDINMPQTDGYEVCRQLKSSKETADIPVIFITTLGAAENEEAGLNLGAVDFIARPFIPAILNARISTHIDLKRQRVGLERLLELRTQEYEKQMTRDDAPSPEGQD